MKKLVSALLCLCMLFSLFGCQAQKNTNQTNEKKTEPKINYTDNLKAVWLSFYEIGDIFKNLNETQAKEKLNKMFADLAERGINTVFFHVRAFCDAFYKSAYFPVSAYCSGEYDLLKHAVYYAHKHKLSIHAWVNPYRVALDTTIDRLPDASPAVNMYKENKADLMMVDNNIFLNPASVKAQKLILNGIREIVSAYDVDGIHFDDYFYPTDSEEIDKSSYAAYLNSGGKLNLPDYRRESVSNLIAAVHSCIQAVNPHIVFGVSPQCFIEKNHDVLFADIAAWVQRGSVDYLLPQIYFGFENETAPFEECVNTWVEFLKGKDCALYVGLALYKSGKPDEYASEDRHSATSAYYEWINHDNIVAREIKCLKERGVKGYCLYSYASLCNAGDNEQLAIEVENLAPLLKQ
ncbi:MAG: hypothetical protein E7517_08975 [Ruminococcaceae bacterium]|nr:hypothetical protein [Oscillospiraceae bacterium]